LVHLAGSGSSALHFERSLLKAGRRLGVRPPVDRDALRIGFDAAGRAVVTEEYSGFLHGRLYHETFVLYDGDVVEAAHFDTGGPIYLHEYRFEDGLMRSADMVARRGSGRESYTYTDGRISRVESEHDGRAASALTAEHDEGGVVRVVEVIGRRSEVRYERPPAGFDLDAACQTVKDALLTLIPDAVAGLVIEVRSTHIGRKLLPRMALAFGDDQGLAPRPGRGRSGN
jgi:hypothetical protein